MDVLSQNILESINDSEELSIHEYIFLYLDISVEVMLLFCSHQSVILASLLTTYCRVNKCIFGTSFPHSSFHWFPCVLLSEERKFMQQIFRHFSDVSSEHL